jgi:hypothetical protein
MMSKLYRVCPVGSDYALYETERLSQAEKWAENYFGFYKELEIKTVYLQDATIEELAKEG